ncbi:MAG: glycosyltransferase [Myxococcota bacterium]
MRLLLVGAFPFPPEQGSQVYFQEQALALRAAGAHVHLLTYGPGRPELGLPQTTLPAWAVPRSRRSGPSLGKPLADLVLAARLRRRVASGPTAASRAADSAETASASGRASGSASWDASENASGTASKRASSAASSTGFDAILAHHAEAALAALHALPRSRPPIVYCAHTLLGEELPLYFQSPRDQLVDREPGASGRALAWLGGGLDRWIARRADGWVALTQTAERVMRASSGAPGRRIGPPVADPDGGRALPDDAALLAAHALERRGFFLYCGNLDPYQDLPLLEQVARARAAAGSPERRTEARGDRVRSLPLVVATHALRGAATDPPGSRPVADARALAQVGRLAQAGVRVVPIGSAAEARALFAGARATIVPRRSLGGFPIKLVNSLAAGTPVVAYHGEEWGLVDGHEALVADLDDPVASLAAALTRLERDPALAERLGQGARAHYGSEHRPALVAAATLELIRAVAARRDR